MVHGGEEAGMSFFPNNSVLRGVKEIKTLSINDSFIASCESKIFPDISKFSRSVHL